MTFVSRLLARSLAFAALLSLAAQPVAAQEGPSILRDAETEALLQDMVDPLVEAAGMPRGSVEVVLVNDPSINAFVAGGQRIYVHSGLINAADSANEVQGVLAHELGHISGGHIIGIYDAYGKAAKISLLSTLLGIAAAVAGAGEAAMGAMALGQQPAHVGGVDEHREAAPGDPQPHRLGPVPVAQVPHGVDRGRIGLDFLRHRHHAWPADDDTLRERGQQHGREHSGGVES